MRRIRIAGMAVLGIVMTLGLVVTSGSPAQAVNRMQIHKIQYNSPGPDDGSNSSLNAEWVQLHNRSASRINLSGWTLRDNCGCGHVYTFHNYTIRAHGYVKIHTGRGTNTQTNRYWGRRAYVWNNTGDRATLKNRAGTVIDRCSYSGGDTSVIC
jgi:hypothetical protein